MDNQLKDLLEKKIQNYRIKVLLIDDQNIVGETVKRMLNDIPEIDFYFCMDPANAISRAVEIEPTIILQDLIMPDIDGLTLVKFYRAHPKLKDIPIIVLSSKEEATTKAEMFEKGANDYLVKLPDKIELIARIKYHSNAYINLLQRNEAYQSLDKSQKALASELNKAAEYVISLLPEKLNKDDIKTDWRFIPSEQLGGDAFGYHWIDDNHFSFYLLDVCGHGVGSALLSVSAITMLRGQTLSGADFTNPESVAIALNKAFQMADHNNLYFTLWYGVFNKTTREIKYISAGHPPAIVVNNNKFEKLTNENFIIGGLTDFPFTSVSTTIAPNSNLYIFSDGVYEIDKPDGKYWTLDEMEVFLENNIALDNSELDKLFTYTQELSGKTTLDDDFSIIKITFQ